MRTEVGWDYETLTRMAIWRYAPKGLVLGLEELGRLPMDRVPFEDRQSDEMRIEFISLEEAQGRRDIRAAFGERVGVSELQGRYTKLFYVILWRFANEGTSFTRGDFSNLPGHLVLSMAGYKRHLELRFMPPAEAARLYQYLLEHEGIDIKEKPF